MRRTERIPVEIAVNWTRAGRAVACHALDVNAHGMFLRTSEIVEPESLMNLEVILPERVLQMFVTARFVGWTASGQGIGVEIFLIDDVSRRHWLAFYEELAASYARARRAEAMGG
jgi:hypothetical protein